MKAKLFFLVIITSIFTTPAFAGDAWIKVDANGNAIGGAIICTNDVCGDSQSEFNKATLLPGERYVLQFKADPVTGNAAGIGVENNPNIKLHVNLETNEWTKVTNVELPKSSVLNAEKQTTVISKVEKWNPYDVTNNSPQENVQEITDLQIVDNSMFGWLALLFAQLNNLWSWLESFMAGIQL